MQAQKPIKSTIYEPLQRVAYLRTAYRHDKADEHAAGRVEPRDGLGAVAPFSFVAADEVAGYPICAVVQGRLPAVITEKPLAFRI